MLLIHLFLRNVAMPFKLSCEAPNPKKTCSPKQHPCIKTKTLLFPLTTQSEASCHQHCWKTHSKNKEKKEEEEEEDQNPREITDQDQSSLHTKLTKECFKIWRESNQCKKSPPKCQKLTNKRLSTHESNPSRQRGKKKHRNSETQRIYLPWKTATTPSQTQYTPPPPPKKTTTTTTAIQIQSNLLFSPSFLFFYFLFWLSTKAGRVCQNREK